MKDTPPIGLGTYHPATQNQFNATHQVEWTNQDQADLVRIGRREILQRRFGFMAILGFSCTVIITWEATLITLATSFTNGGYAGTIWNYVIVWVGTWSVFASMCELASMAPVAGGQYYWVSFLAPQSSQRFFSYVTGWLTLCGWQASVASGSYISGTMIQGMISLNYPEYQPRGWHAMLLFWAVYLFSVAINTMARFLLPRFESLILVLHILGFFAILIPLASLGPKNSASQVFTVFSNGGDWPTQGLSFMVGMIGAVYSFVGADAAIHMSEEIKNASVVVPRAIMLSMFLNGITGFSIVLATLFSIVDAESAFGGDADYPFMEILAEAMSSIGGATTLAAVITAMQISATVGALASASRMLWSFSRDKAVPHWRFFQKLDHRTSIPVRCIGMSSVVSILLSLITLGSSTAFNNIVSLVTVGLYSSYLLVISLLLWRRLTGTIIPYDPTHRTVVNTPGADIMWGPWRLPNTAGIAVNTFAVIFSTVAMFFMFWPPENPVTTKNMNYSCLVMGTVITAAVAYYVFRAKTTFKGVAREY